MTYTFQIPTPHSYDSRRNILRRIPWSLLFMIHETSSSFFSIVFALSHIHFAHSVHTVTSYPILQAPTLNSLQWAQYVFQIHLGLRGGRSLSFVLCLILLLPAHRRHLPHVLLISAFPLLPCYSLASDPYSSTLLLFFLLHMFTSATLLFDYPSTFIKTALRFLLFRSLTKQHQPFASSSPVDEPAQLNMCGERLKSTTRCSKRNPVKISLLDSPYSSARNDFRNVKLIIGSSNT